MKYPTVAILGLLFCGCTQAVQTNSPSTSTNFVYRGKTVAEWMEKWTTRKKGADEQWKMMDYRHNIGMDVYDMDLEAIPHFLRHRFKVGNGFSPVEQAECVAAVFTFETGWDPFARELARQVKLAIKDKDAQVRLNAITTAEKRFIQLKVWDVKALCQDENDDVKRLAKKYPPAMMDPTPGK
jgi:hypothetical protein